MSDNTIIDTSILKEVFLTPSQEIRATKPCGHAPCGGGSSATNECEQAPCNGVCKSGDCTGFY